jgi:phospholipid-translocating ATPase
MTREASNKDVGQLLSSTPPKVASNKVASLTEEDLPRGYVEYEVEVCRTEQLVVGDIIRVDDDCAVPADCFLLASEKNRVITEDGSCFISTESLNGERALDPKMAIREVLTNLPEIICGGGQRQLMEVQCREGPVSNLNSFDGQVKLVDVARQHPLIDLSIKQFIPRGAYVRNSGRQYMMVLFTGVDTKLIMNQGNYQYKTSSIDKYTNVMLFCQVMMMFAFSGLLVLGEYRFSRSHDRHSYMFEKAFQKPSDYAVLAGKSFGSFYLLNNSFVPFDMVSAVEIVKLLITMMFENDAEMMVIDQTKLYKSNADSKLTDDKIQSSFIGCSAQNLNIHEDLGQVDFVFCDKTGTLTQNELLFRQFKFCHRAPKKVTTINSHE